MACTNGRPKLSQDQDRQLFAESAGTCLLCSTALFADVGSGRSVAIAERAHVVAHSPEGPRGNENVPGCDREAPENIVLLCPTCHTLIDKEPATAPADELFERKAARAAAVALVGGAPVFATRPEAHSAVTRVLRRNHLIWSHYGPDPDDGSLGTVEEVDRWSRHVLEDIVPGNELIVAIVRMNPTLATVAEEDVADMLAIHTADLRTKHSGQPLIAPARRFPAGTDSLFVEDEDDRA